MPVSRSGTLGLHRSAAMCNEETTHGAETSVPRSRQHPEGPATRGRRSSRHRGVTSGWSTAKGTSTLAIGVLVSPNRVAMPPSVGSAGRTSGSLQDRRLRVTDSVDRLFAVRPAVDGLEGLREIGAVEACVVLFGEFEEAFRGVAAGGEGGVHVQVVAWGGPAEQCDDLVGDCVVGVEDGADVELCRGGVVARFAVSSIPARVRRGEPPNRVRAARSATAGKTAQSRTGGQVGDSRKNRPIRYGPPSRRQRGEPPRWAGARAGRLQVEFLAGFCAEFAEHLGHVLLDRPAGEEHRLGDLAVGAAVGQQARHLAFTGREFVAVAAAAAG